MCTHSYSLVWYDWAAWERFIDWQALSGINHVLSMTGQEEVQWKVFTQFNLTDDEIRSWFNGPAFLTWSRGQNEYGNNIAGPLPRSWMRDQWAMQKLILARQRSLGIVGQLPAFQGNVPWALAALQRDSNMTQQGDTGWMSSLDPLFGKIADVWMATLCADFGCTDHWYQVRVWTLLLLLLNTARIECAVVPSPVLTTPQCPRRLAARRLLRRRDCPVARAGRWGVWQCRRRRCCVRAGPPCRISSGASRVECTPSCMHLVRATPKHVPRWLRAELRGVDDARSRTSRLRRGPSLRRYHCPSDGWPLRAAGLKRPCFLPVR